MALFGHVNEVMTSLHDVTSSCKYEGLFNYYVALSEGATNVTICDREIEKVGRVLRNA